MLILTSLALGVLLACGAALLVTSANPAAAASSPEMDDSAELRQAVSVEGIMAHERRFQEIAHTNGGKRAASTLGYDASANYVADQLRAAGYNVTLQSFQFKNPCTGVTRTTSNVIAETTTGDPAHTIVVGAHLDSAAKAPGIQDNGSGAATILEIALQVSKLEIQLANRVCFAFWGAKELGLLGSNTDPGY